jgi:malate dehydrogenase (oxaloacetate-decarboxylating)
MSGPIKKWNRVVSTDDTRLCALIVRPRIAIREGTSLLPHIDDLRALSMTVAASVAEAAHAEGLATVKLSDVVQEIQNAMWQPEYCRIVAT